MFTVNETHENPKVARQKMLKRAKRDSKGIRADHAATHYNAILNAGAIDVVLRSMKLHCNSQEIQSKGMRLLGFFASKSDDVRREIVMKGGLDLVMIQTAKLNPVTESIARWCCNLLECVSWKTDFFFFFSLTTDNDEKKYFLFLHFLLHIEINGWTSSKISTK